MELFTIQFFPASYYFLLCPNIVLSTQYSNILNIWGFISCGILCRVDW